MDAASNIESYTVLTATWRLLTDIKYHSVCWTENLIISIYDKTLWTGFTLILITVRLWKKKRCNNGELKAVNFEVKLFFSLCESKNN